MNARNEGVSDNEIKEAHTIYAVDSNVPEFQVQLVGEDLAPPLVSKGGEAFELKSLEIEIDSKNLKELRELIERVKKVRKT